MHYTLDINSSYGCGVIMEKKGLQMTEAASLALARTAPASGYEFVQVARNWVYPESRDLLFPTFKDVEQFHQAQTVFLRSLILHLNDGTRSKPKDEDIPYSFEVVHGFPQQVRNAPAIRRAKASSPPPEKPGYKSLLILRDDGTGILRDFCALTPRPDLFKKFEKALPQALARAYVMELELLYSREETAARKGNIENVFRTRRSQRTDHLL